MSMNSEEKKFLKAVESMLNHDLLGLDVHDVEESSHHSQFRWEEVANAFRLKCVKSPYCESMAAAFRKTHDYKYIDHPTFKLAMEADMRSMGLPRHVMDLALKYVDELVNDLSESKPSEKDAGWPDMDAMHDVTTKAHDRTPKADKPFTGGLTEGRAERRRRTALRKKKMKKRPDLQGLSKGDGRELLRAVKSSQSDTKNKPKNPRKSADHQAPYESKQKQVESRRSARRKRISENRTMDPAADSKSIVRQMRKAVKSRDIETVNSLLTKAESIMDSALTHRNAESYDRASNATTLGRKFLQNTR